MQRQVKPQLGWLRLRLLVILLHFEATRVNLNDYLIGQDGKDWPDLLSGWLKLFPQAFTIWMVNRFGDIVAVFEDGTVHFLDVSIGSLDRIANDRDHFIELIDQGDNAKGWLLINLVDSCVAAGLVLKDNQCYSFKVPPILGGDYLVQNVAPTDLSVHYSFLADIYFQTKDLPPGTKVHITIKNNKQQVS